jgi:ParB family transcriptional regulator, chromosome partitioning protein
MTTQTIAVAQIKANPYQARLADDPEHIQGIADSIRTDGLLQTPLARRINGHYELAFGHSRLAAWQIAKPGEPFPLEVRELTDRQMSDAAASENGRRKNLSAIETATAIERRIRDFKLSQLEAAKPFGYTSQGGVSNLLRLLKLPETVRAMVQDGRAVELIRRALVKIPKLRPEHRSRSEKGKA